MSEQEIASIRRRRGAVKGSLTRLETHLAELERGDPSVDSRNRLAAQQLLGKLNTYDKEFRDYHFALIEILDERLLETEQTVLDEHDGRVTNLSVRLQQLTSSIPPSLSTVEPSQQRRLGRRLAHLEEKTQAIESVIQAIDSHSSLDTCLIQQYEQRLNNIELELTSVSNDILAMDEDVPDLLARRTQLDKTTFDFRVKIRRLLTSVTSTQASTASEPGVRLPKMEVPRFDGNIASWIYFWEQFQIAVHDKQVLTASEKLTYLRHALKDGSAKHLAEGLSTSGDQYGEAIECLQKRFDRPRILHQTHVRAIVEAPRLKDGQGKELRRLHDTVSQHLRALKAMDYEPPGPFVTSILELKLDPNTMFEWQRHSQSSAAVPHYTMLLEFVDLRAQASESSASEINKKGMHQTQLDKSSFKRYPGSRSVTSCATIVEDTCTVCKNNKQPLYACPRFKSLPHDQMLTTLREQGACMNCLRIGHVAKHCTSTHRCRRCQRPHHTLLHVEVKTNQEPPVATVPASPPMAVPASSTVHSHLAHIRPKSNRQPLLMTSQVLIVTREGVTTQARALLDSASSSSFISERMAQHLRLPRSHRMSQVTGIGGISHKALSQSVVCFQVAPRWPSTVRFAVEAIVLPKVTTELPLSPIAFDPRWHHLSEIPLADPDFGVPGNVDILLGIDTFIEALRDGRRCGPPGSPVGVETSFGWILAGSINCNCPISKVASHFTTVQNFSGDELLRKFWEVEEVKSHQPNLMPDERLVVTQFQEDHSRDKHGRFIVPLPKSPAAMALGESRSLAVRRFLSLESKLRVKGQFQALDEVIQEYFQMDHAEIVPGSDLYKPREEVFYLPVQAVVKESSSTTKIRAVFDASAKSTSGVSLNDQLMVGPTVHSSLIDVLLRFRLHQIGLTTDVSRMYRAILLQEKDRDLHRFVWRSEPDHPLLDFRMTRVTFGVASSSFAANMCVKQNAIDYKEKYPLAAAAVHTSFYVDDGLVGADSLQDAIELQQQLQRLFDKGGFLLRKWKSSEPSVLRHLPDHLLDMQVDHRMPESDNFSKTLGIEWSTSLNSFRLTVQEFPQLEVMTKRALISDVAKIYDVLGWFAPVIIQVKILMQQLWESGIGWDEPVPDTIRETWEKWRRELPVLKEKLIARRHFPKNASVSLVQLHGFSDASETAYAGAVYVCTVDVTGTCSVSLVMAKTRVAPLKRLTIPRLELCGAK